MHRHWTALRGAAMAVASLGAAIACAHPARAAAISVAPATLSPIATVDERYQSYNVEMAEVIGGNFWKPYDTLPGGTAQTATSAAAASPSGGAGLQAGQDTTMFQTRPPIDLTNAR